MTQRLNIKKKQKKIKIYNPIHWICLYIKKVKIIDYTEFLRAYQCCSTVTCFNYCSNNNNLFLISIQN